MWPFIGGAAVATSLIILGEIYFHRSLGDLTVRVIGGTRAAYQHTQAVVAKATARGEALAAKLKRQNNSVKQ